MCIRDRYVGETKGKVVFDLYSGTGTIAQILAPVAEKVVGVEIVGEAVEAARENAARNGLGKMCIRDRTKRNLSIENNSRQLSL